MIKSGEKTAFELRSQGNNDKLISEFNDLVVTCKYLIRNISIDFTNKTIDYYSLFRTLNEIIILIKTDSSSNGSSLRLSNRYSLLWFYLRQIFINNCSVIFDIHHHHKAFIIYLVMEFWTRSGVCGVNELYPNSLRLLIERLYEKGSQQLYPISELLGIYQLKYDRNHLRAPEKISNYIELARSLSENSKKYSLSLIWRIKALAELEVHLFLHGRKVDYSTKL